jgi:hypothetical protein
MVNRAPVAIAGEGGSHDLPRPLVHRGRCARGRRRPRPAESPMQRVALASAARPPTRIASGRGNRSMTKVPGDPAQDEDDRSATASRQVTLPMAPWGCCRVLIDLMPRKLRQGHPAARQLRPSPRMPVPPTTKRLPSRRAHRNPPPIGRTCRPFTARRTTQAIAPDRLRAGPSAAPQTPRRRRRRRHSVPTKIHP